VAYLASGHAPLLARPGGKALKSVSDKLVKLAIWGHGACHQTRMRKIVYRDCN